MDFNTIRFFVRFLPPWSAHALCAGKPTELWFPESDREVDTEAVQRVRRKYCLPCPVKRECLEWAFENPDSMLEGIYGGTTGQDRDEERRRGPGYIDRLLSEEERDVSTA